MAARHIAQKIIPPLDWMFANFALLAFDEDCYSLLTLLHIVIVGQTHRRTEKTANYCTYLQQVNASRGIRITSSCIVRAACMHLDESLPIHEPGAGKHAHASSDRIKQEGALLIAPPFGSMHTSTLGQREIPSWKTKLQWMFQK
jgi:hypothetical protein